MNNFQAHCIRLKELVRQESHTHRQLQWGHHNFVEELIFLTFFTAGEE